MVSAQQALKFRLTNQPRELSGGTVVSVSVCRSSFTRNAPPWHIGGLFFAEIVDLDMVERLVRREAA